MDFKLSYFYKVLKKIRKTWYYDKPQVEAMTLKVDFSDLIRSQ